MSTMTLIIETIFGVDQNQLRFFRNGYATLGSNLNFESKVSSDESQSRDVNPIHGRRVVILATLFR